MEIYESARKHGISDEDIRHGVEHAVAAADEGDTSKILSPTGPGTSWRS